MKKEGFVTRGEIDRGKLGGGERRTRKKRENDSPTSSEPLCVVRAHAQKTERAFGKEGNAARKKGYNHSRNIEIDQKDPDGRAKNGGSGEPGRGGRGIHFVIDSHPAILLVKERYLKKKN